ncbi:MAG: hypothetical protein LAP86_15720 [Acidobacteriia bacterium]|nr:hypothetical protein [Terriglobia bacterium]
MLRDNLVGLIEPMLSSAGANPLALFTEQKKSSDDRLQDALKIPAPKGRNLTLTENAASPFHAEPRHKDVIDWQRGLRQYSNSSYEGQYQNWKQTGKLPEIERATVASNPSDQFETFLVVPNLGRFGSSADDEGTQ